MLGKTVDGSLRETASLRGPYGAAQTGAVMNVDPGQQQAVHRGAQGQVAAGGLGQGATPVAVSVPVQGQPFHFEKLLALGEELWVGFDFKGLKR